MRQLFEGLAGWCCVLFLTRVGARLLVLDLFLLHEMDAHVTWEYVSNFSWRQRIQLLSRTKKWWELRCISSWLEIEPEIVCGTQKCICCHKRAQHIKCWKQLYSKDIWNTIYYQRRHGSSKLLSSEKDLKGCESRLANCSEKQNARPANKCIRWWWKCGGSETSWPLLTDCMTEAWIDGASIACSTAKYEKGDSFLQKNFCIRSSRVAYHNCAIGWWDCSKRSLLDFKAKKQKAPAQDQVAAASFSAASAALQRINRVHSTTAWCKQPHPVMSSFTVCRRYFLTRGLWSRPWWDSTISPLPQANFHILEKKGVVSVEHRARRASPLCTTLTTDGSSAGLRRRREKEPGRLLHTSEAASESRGAFETAEKEDLFARQLPISYGSLKTQLQSLINTLIEALWIWNWNSKEPAEVWKRN